MSEYPPSRIRFSDLATRDRWIQHNHPVRECTDTPGLYRLPSGQTMSVINLAVILYPLLPQRRDQ